MTTSSSARTLAVFLTGAGAMHFIAPKFYDAMIPPQLPGAARTWTYGSGVAEAAVGGLVAWPRTRRTGGLAAALLFVAVLPANVQMAVDARRRNRPGYEQAVTVARLPLQLPLIRWALTVRDSV